MRLGICAALQIAAETLDLSNSLADKLNPRAGKAGVGPLECVYRSSDLSEPAESVVPRKVVVNEGLTATYFAEQVLIVLVGGRHP